MFYFILLSETSFLKCFQTTFGVGHIKIISGNLSINRRAVFKKIKAFVLLLR